MDGEEDSELDWLETQQAVFRATEYNSPHPAARAGPRRFAYAAPSAARWPRFRPGVALAVNAGLEESFRRSLTSEWSSARAQTDVGALEAPTMKGGVTAGTMPAHQTTTLCRVSYLIGPGAARGRD